MKNTSVNAAAGQAIAWLAAMALLTGCGSTSFVSVESEQSTGKEAARQVTNEIGLYDADFLASYIDAVGHKLVAFLDDPQYSFEFRVVDQAEPNAFALPGGYIYISRGMLALINSEDELAGILAHEISHVTLRHHAQQVSRSIVPGLLTLPGKAVGAVVGEDIGEMINAPIEAAGKVYLSSYSRTQETEADRVGMQLAATAGYDPAALGIALETLELTVDLLTGEQRKFSFYDTHPTTPTRIADVEKLARRITWSPSRRFAADQAELFRRLDGLWWGPVNPANGVFHGQQFLHADLDFTITFPEGWTLVNTPRFVGAFEQDEKALAILGGPEPAVDPEIPARAFIAEMKEQAGLEPAESGPVEIGNWPAWLVRFEDPSGAEPVSLYYLWVSSPTTTFQAIGLGADEYRDLLGDTARSLRALTQEERESIYGYKLNIVAARQDETFAAISTRTDNALSEELTAVINGLPSDGLLEDGELIKVVRKEKY